jgi:tetratricopeptide (TPR) repeat protein
MNHQTRFRNYQSILRIIMLLATSAMLPSFSGHVDGQTTASSPEALSLEAQTKLVRAIFDATKKTRTAKDYTAFLAQCQDALDQGLSTKNRRYVVSLTGWALNRRGEKRFELAQQLKKIENTQYESVIKQVMDDLDQAIIAAPDRHRSWMSRGIAHVFNQDHDKAILDFTKVTKLKADDPNGWFNRAEALYERRNFEHAIKDYDVALRLNSDDAQAMAGRGHALFSLGRYEDALVNFNRVVTQLPANDIALVNRADTFQRLGKWELAEKDYQAAIKIAQTGLACQRLAWLKATCPNESVRDSQAAQQLIDRAITLSGETSMNLDTLAAVKAAVGDFEFATTTQQKVIGLVGAELDIENSQYQARLSLYENSEPYTQKPVDQQSDSEN